MSGRLNKLLIFGTAVLFFACKPTVPRHVIQPDDMEDILYDYHVSDGIANLENDSTRFYNNRLYKLAVLKKHGVTEAEFDSSMVYYTRHTERLYAIYERLAERMGNDALALGADVNSVNKYNTENGEAVNVWTGERSHVFLPMAPYNQLSFKLPVDTSYYKGDRMVMDFDAQFLYQEGMRDGVALLVVRFANDSVASRLMHMSSNTHYTLEVRDDKNLGIKDVRGMFYLNRDRNATVTTLKVMLLKDIRIIRLHEEKKKKGLDEEAKNDSTRREAVGPEGPPPPPDGGERPETPPDDRPMNVGDRPVPPPSGGERHGPPPMVKGKMMPPQPMDGRQGPPDMNRMHDDRPLPPPDRRTPQPR